MFGGALLGMWVRTIVPDRHLSDAARDAVLLAMGLLSVMSALVLGFALSSSKSSLDAHNAAIEVVATDILTLDRLLVRYGPEANEIRDLLRRAVIFKLNATWPDRQSGSAEVLETPGATSAAEDIEDRIRGLTPHSDAQRWLQTRALEVSTSLLQKRWVVFAEAGSSIALPFFVLLLLWLTILFTTYGLFAPRGPVVTTVLLLCALSVSSAVFLIYEMDRPMEGLIKVSDAPVRYALSHLKQ